MIPPIMGKRPGKSDEQWQEARRRCGLSAADVRMAKQLGMTPRSLIKNIPSKAQPWKTPVRLWVRDLYARRFGKTSSPAPADIVAAAGELARTEMPRTRRRVLESTETALR